MIITDYYDNVW